MKEQDRLQTVRDHYGQAARRVLVQGERASCCSGSPACCSPLPANPHGDAASLYADDQLARLTPDTVQASLGCGNPVSLAELQAGEHVLDLGSGGGIDVFLAARVVGPRGLVTGLDMTEDMVCLAERNRQQAGANNVRFIQGQMESIPLPEAAVDVVISNCVINLSTDKDRVMQEAYRVLRPGGRLVVSDTVFTGQVPAGIRADDHLWACCVGGALHVDDYRAILQRTGFEDISIEITGHFEEAGITVAQAAVKGRKPS